MKLKGVFALAALPLLAAGAEIKEVRLNGSPMTGVENTFFKAVVNPIGGLLQSIIYKPGNFQLTDEARGSGSENCWNINESRFFLQKKPYTLTTEKSGGKTSVSASANEQGGGINFLRVNKSYNFYDNEARIGIDYNFENLPDAMSALNYGFWIQHILGVYGEKLRYFYPTETGINVHDPLKSGVEVWKFRPARGWLAAADSKGRGVAVTMAYPYLRCFYSWFSGMRVPTTEWRLEQVAIPDGKSFSTSCDILPFTGLKNVSGAGNGFVGEIAAPAEAEGDTKIKIGVNLHSAKAVTVEVELSARTAPNGKWKSLAVKTLKFSKPGTVAGFEIPFTGEFDSLLEMQAVVRVNGKEMCVLDGAINFDDCSEKWALAPREEKFSAAGNKVDLLCFNNVAPMEHIPFAKPLPGKKLKALFLVHYTNISEVTALANRLDMEFVSPYLFNSKGSPQWRLGDYFGILSESDIAANLDKALKEKYDCIVIGGMPWKKFSAAQRKAITDKVKAGCGLIYVGAQAIDGTFAMFNPAANPAKISAVPQAVDKDAPAVPWELMGSEQVWKHSVKSGKVLAKAGDAPYLAAGNMGKGKVFFLNYNTLYGRFSDAAGITPDFASEYTDRTSPHEFYFLLLSKLIREAAGRADSCTVSPEFSGGKVKLSVNSKTDGKVTVETTVYNPFMTKTASAQTPAALKAGANTVDQALTIAPFGGTQSLWCIVRNEANQVLFSGAWAVKNPADARIATVKTESQFARGERPLHTLIKVSGKTAGKKLIIEAWDSFDRLIYTKTFPAAAEVRDNISLNNELPSRFARITARLNDGKADIDRRDAFVTVRPLDKTLVWDDFEVGTWMSDDGSRRYLWKEQAKMMHANCFSSVIANTGRYAINFPVRFNIHPSLLGDLGLGRGQEPPEYAKTGNKMLLVRKRCLSDTDLLNRNREALKRLAAASDRNAVRFAWMGDEQSITSYGGTPIDLCFSEHCLREFRVFLKEKYGDIAALNREWNTSFADFDKVVPFTKEEVWKNSDNVAGWADHLEFMDGRLENAAKYQLQDFGKIAPQVRISMSGTQAPTAYGGMDWSRMMTVFNSLLNYYVGGQEELQRSFAPDGRFAPWNFGYSNRGGEMGTRILRSLYVGSYGIYGFCYPTLVNPDWTLPKAMKDSLPHFRRITSGIGKHYLNNLKELPETAVLYSQASLRAAFFEKRLPRVGENFVKYNALLRHCGISFNYVPSTKLKEGALKGYKYLILPDCAALSDDEVNAVRDFVSQGGKVYAEGIPGRLKQNCVPRKEAPLAEIFTRPGNVLKAKPDYSYQEVQTYPGKPENYAGMTAEQNALKKFVSGGKLLKVTCKGKAVADVEIYPRRSSGGDCYYGIVTNDGKQREMTFEFPVSGHIYEALTGKYYGKGSKVTRMVSNSSPVLFAVTREEHKAPQAVMEGDTLKLSGKGSADTVCHVELTRPDGGIAHCYTCNITARNGKAEYRIPFVSSDMRGEWTISVTEAVSKEQIKIKHNVL